MHLKLFQKDLFKKQQKQLVIWSVIKLLIKLQKFQKIHNKEIRDRKTKEYIYLQEEDRNLLMIWD